MPQVSVVIPAYNSGKYICEAINSVLEQTYKDYEIIVIDDGSTDNTKELLSKYAGKIRYFYQKNRGVSAARNKGIKEASGEYVAFLDSDDIWMPEKLYLQLDELKNQKDCSWVYCDSKFIYEKDCRKNLLKKYRGYHGDIFEDLFRGYHIYTPTVVVKRECFESVGYFNEALSHSEDYDLFLRLARKYRVAYVDKKLFLRRVHKNSICRTGYAGLSEDSRLKVLNDCVRNNYDYFKKKEKLIKAKFGDLHYRNAWIYFFETNTKTKAIKEFLISIRYGYKIRKSILGISLVLCSDIKMVRDKLKNRWVAT